MIFWLGKNPVTCEFTGTYKDNDLKGILESAKIWNSWPGYVDNRVLAKRRRFVTYSDMFAII